MERLLDKVKLNLTGETEKYFRNVEVESIEKSKDNKTLNFSLISTDIIPFIIIKNARKTFAEQLLNTKFEDESKNPIILNISYKLSEKYTPKIIFEEIKKDFYEELKEHDRVLAVYFYMAKIDFIDDTMNITLDQDKFFKEDELRLVEYIKKIFKDRFNIELNIETKFEKILSDGKPERPKTVKAEENINEPVNIKSAAEVYGEGKKKKHDKKCLFNLEGDVLYGFRKKTKSDYVKVNEIDGSRERVAIKGILYNYELRNIKEDRLLITNYIFDGESCITVKIWANLEDKEIYKTRFKVGDELEIDGKVIYDNYLKSYTINPSSVVLLSERQTINVGNPGEDDFHAIFITDREDNEKEKRVELHLHTKMSAKDGIGDVRQYMETALKFGMKSMAITDHGCVNALAEAYEYKVGKGTKEKFKDFKLIYGVEGYLVEDYDAYIYDEDKKATDKNAALTDNFVVYTITSTGFNKKNDSVIQISAKKIKDLHVVDTFSAFVKYDKPLKLSIKEKTGINDSDLTNAKTIINVLCDFMDFAKGSILVTTEKNSAWELSSLLKENKLKFNFTTIDIMALLRLYFPDAKGLIAMGKNLKVKIEGVTDRKKNDPRKQNLTPKEHNDLVSEIIISLFNKLKTDESIDDLNSIRERIKIDEKFISKQQRFHIVLLAKNDVGRVNLYKLVTESHIRYMYNGKPCIPRSLLNRYREGLVVGSACIIGEFMNAIRYGADNEKLRGIASYYDYIEIQPTMNNSFLLNDDKDNFKSKEDLEKLNIKAIEIAESLGKPVCATCDCHYVEKEDKIYREILTLGSSFKKSNLDENGKLKDEVKLDMESSGDELLYFRTTKEMLDEFSYLGVDKAYEVVVKNTNLIDSMIENIDPLRHDKCPPNQIKDSDNELRKACYENLEKTFGKTINPAIKDRLDKELDYIIKNGYSVMYITAKRLIDYSNETGNPVGSRGSVGSSFAATMAGISEVNPLPPFYLCSKCKHLEYDTEETRKYNNDSGFDMPDKMCPECGTKMIKDGINIPFETFLGIPGDPKAQKEPDIDLNFCSNIQSDIHKYTIKLFGESNTFKAGTTETVAPKTAYGYVMKYNDIHEKNFSYQDADFMKNNILECKRTSGQHPGGMIVMPDGEDICTFTPIQYPADKEESGLTTHYDYHKIDKNLLKLDILGHDAPPTLRMLKKLTGVDFNNVPFYEKEVLDLFKDTSSLGVSPSDISGTKLGCLTIPEFGTDNAMNMVLDAKPKTVADLIRLSGLAHGTNVWKGNVQDLIHDNVCTLSEAICCRDDIMLYLIDKGLDEGTAFNIMELVRKGKTLTATQEEEMRKYGVPDWYIECCNKIEYMFPKAHAAAYVTAALKIAYYKVHYPVEYYAAYFSIRKEGLEYKMIMQDKDEIHFKIENIGKKLSELSKFGKKFKDSDDDTENVDDIFKETSETKLYAYYDALRVVEEMLARGVEFIPIDIYSAKGTEFSIFNGKIMPSFDTIPGLVSAAEACEKEPLKGLYTSVENFVERTGVNKTVLQYMKDCGLLRELKESSEATLFDFL